MSGWRSAPLPPDWSQTVKRIKERDPYCVLCLTLPAPRYSPTVDIDHIGDPNDHRDSNLRGLCEWHHDRRTSQQANAARKRVTQRRPVEKHPGLR